MNKDEFKMIHYHILKTPLSGRCEALRYGFATGYRQLTMVTTNHINVSRLFALLISKLVLL